jgi:hypothetical protein
MKKPVDLVKSNSWASKIKAQSRVFKKGKGKILAESAGKLPRWR